MALTATAEPIVWIIRVGQDHRAFGDPWEFCCTVTYNGEVAWLHAGQGAMTKAVRRAVAAELRRLGFRRVRWERVTRDGGWRIVEKEL